MMVVVTGIASNRNLEQATGGTAVFAALPHVVAAAGVGPGAQVFAVGWRDSRECLPRAATLASSFRGKGQRPACPSLCGKFVAMRQSVGRDVDANM